MIEPKRLVEFEPILAQNQDGGSVPIASSQRFESSEELTCPFHEQPMTAPWMTRFDGTIDEEAFAGQLVDEHPSGGMVFGSEVGQRLVERMASIEERQPTGKPGVEVGSRESVAEVFPRHETHAIALAQDGKRQRQTGSMKQGHRLLEVRRVDSVRRHDPEPVKDWPKGFLPASCPTG
jgi:hypothetical protein